MHSVDEHCVTFGIVLQYAQHLPDAPQASSSNPQQYPVASAPCQDNQAKHEGESGSCGSCGGAIAAAGTGGFSCHHPLQGGAISAPQGDSAVLRSTGGIPR